jgi:hypothetical protein
MTTATIFSSVPEANESSQRSSVESEALDVFPSVSHPAYQNFEMPTNLFSLSTLFLSTASE